MCNRQACQGKPAWCMHADSGEAAAARCGLLLAQPACTRLSLGCTAVAPQPLPYLPVSPALQFLPKHYNSENVVEGKAAARAELRKRWVAAAQSALQGPLAGVGLQAAQLPGAAGLTAVAGVAGVWDAGQLPERAMLTPEPSPLPQAEHGQLGRQADGGRGVAPHQAEG